MIYSIDKLSNSYSKSLLSLRLLRSYMAISFVTGINTILSSIYVYLYVSKNFNKYW